MNLKPANHRSSSDFYRRIARIIFCSLALSFLCAAPAAQPEGVAARPVDYANPLVGTASLDKPELVGNAPPPGEETYTGFTHPGPALPHRDVLLGPINKDLTDAAGNHGIIFPYIHAR